jgi:hypothetical protein
MQMFDVFRAERVSGGLKHARPDCLLLAENHLTVRLFGSMVRKIAALPDRTGWGAK